ncbi:hypothetical protein [Nonomuraea fuscirosea]|uniref:hypothetical protein n=1 Tax=Nonomuraea fuscirosea TaxID=1291556 RepID=UPI0034020759
MRDHDVVWRSYDNVAEESTARMHDELVGKPLYRALEMRMEHIHYAHEAETRRDYLMVRRAAAA